MPLGTRWSVGCCAVLNVETRGNSEPTSDLPYSCLGIGMIDLDGVIERDWIALLEDNWVSFASGTGDSHVVCSFADVRKPLTYTLISSVPLSRFLFISCILCQSHSPCHTLISILCLCLCICLSAVNLSFHVPFLWHPSCSQPICDYVRAIRQTYNINNESREWRLSFCYHCCYVMCEYRLEKYRLEDYSTCI